MRSMVEGARPPLRPLTRFRPRKRRRHAPRPPVAHPALDHRPPPVGVDQSALRPIVATHDPTMLHRNPRAHAEQQHIPRPRLAHRDLHKPPPRRLQQGLVPAPLGPVRRIRRQRVRLRAVQPPPHPAHQPQAVAPLATHAGPVAVGRADPSARLNQRLRPHRRLPPSWRPPSAGYAVRKSSPGMSGKPRNRTPLPNTPTHVAQRLSQTAPG